MTLTMLVVSLILMSGSLGILPDGHYAQMEHRVALCESIAFSGTVFLQDEDFGSIGAMLSFISERSDGKVLSAGVRSADGDLIIDVHGHESKWVRTGDQRSTETQMQIPLLKGDGEPWGTVEVRFAPLTTPGIVGWLTSPVVRLVLFVGLLSHVLFQFYLGKVLQQLDPSRVVPQRVKQTFDTFAGGLVLIDAKERIALANRKFGECVGRSADKLQGVRISRIPWVYDDQGDKSPWAAALEDGQARYSHTIRLPGDGGRMRTLMVNCAPVLGQEGERRGGLISFEDITPLEETKAALEESKKAAEAANVAKTEFLARMSHEIRTPMNAILGFADVLRRGMDSDPHERQDYLNIIHSSGEHLLDLINDILDLSKIEAGRLQVELITESPLKIVSDVISVLKVRADEKSIGLKHEIQGEVPETIQTDPVRLRQMITNLVGNSIKFTSKGGVKVVTRLIRQHGTPKLVFDVVDTGIGIPTERIEQIFDPFTQADSSVTRHFGGTGLGLAISRRLAQALGGDIRVASELGKGSVFSVTIDTGDLTGVRLITERDAVQRRKEDVTHVPTLPPLKILVADDGAANRKLARLVLQRAGAKVDDVENGQQAVDMAAKHNYDVVLLDMQMPVMDGYTAARTLRKRGLKVPIIALTADAMKGSEDRSREAGCSGFLTKPIDMDALVRTVAEATGNIFRESIRTNSATEHSSNVRSSTVLDGPDNAPYSPMEHMPLISTLPMDDPEFCEIVVEFAERLRQKIDEMDATFAAGDLYTLSRLAHWLKGSGGTAGLDAFTDPARELQELAQEGKPERIPKLLAQLRSMSQRVRVPDLQSTAS